MNKVLFKIFFALFGCPFFFCVGANAQTYRVRVGQTPGSCSSYMEVFEYDYVNEKPEFPGGEVEFVSFVNKIRKYPAEAYKQKIQGRVTCAFVVNVDGTISNISVLRGVEPSLNREAVRIIGKMPGWKVGKHNGKPVPVRVIRSVPFRR